MSVLRTLRLCRHLTIAELALKADVPARILIELEYGARPLDAALAARIASVYGLEPAQVLGIDLFRRQERAARQRRLRQRALIAAVLLVSGAFALLAHFYVTRAYAIAQPTAPPTPAPLATVTRTATPPPNPTVTPSPTATPRATATATATATPEPTATPVPRYHSEADGPHGCPFDTEQAVVITQPYGVGTHAPANIWGADDLIIAGAPEATRGAAVVATHAGIVRLNPESWPGGNVAMVYDPAGAWTTLYGHLEAFAVAEGQVVAAGTLLGYAGTTGEASGPHLHYEIRTPGGNIDPEPLIECPAA